MDVYLNEHEVGFDASLVGFPSISGCHAIVLVTQKGMFGYHNAGGSAQASWPLRAGGFAQFYQEHFLRGPGTRLYGVTYVGTNRGYGGVSADRWKGELLAFATALNFAGKIRGYNLDLSGVPASAYVEFRRAGDKAEIYVKHWVDADKTVGFNTDRANHKIVVPRGGGTVITLENQNNQVVTKVTQTGLVRVHSARLRS
jgi:hypothetical protein